MQEGSTPLYRACFSGDVEQVNTLLVGGANVNEQNDVSLVSPLTFHYLFILSTYDVMCPL